MLSCAGKPYLNYEIRWKEGITNIAFSFNLKAENCGQLMAITTGLAAGD